MNNYIGENIEKVKAQVSEKLNKLKQEGKICGWDFEKTSEDRIKFWVRSKIVPGFVTFFDKYSFSAEEGFNETSKKLDEFFGRNEKKIF